MTVNGSNVNESVVFTKIPVVDKVTISLSTRKGGAYGPPIVMKTSGSGEMTIGSTCTISTNAQSYTDEHGVVSYPLFEGWFQGGTIVSTSTSYSFTVGGAASYTAQWAWAR